MSCPGHEGGLVLNLYCQVILKALVPVRSLKLSSNETVQFWDGWTLSNTRYHKQIDLMSCPAHEEGLVLNLYCQVILKALVPVRSLKLSSNETVQFWDGWTLSNTRYHKQIDLMSCPAHEEGLVLNLNCQVILKALVPVRSLKFSSNETVQFWDGWTLSNTRYHKQIDLMSCPAQEEELVLNLYCQVILKALVPVRSLKFSSNETVQFWDGWTLSNTRYHKQIDLMSCPAHEEGLVLNLYCQVILKALVPVRSLKLSSNETVQFWDGWTLSNTRYHKQPGDVCISKTL